MHTGSLLRQRSRLTFSFTKRILRPMSSAPVRFSEPLYRWQEEVENLEAYRSGGYHPVLLDNTYRQNRYRVVHKLGYGSFSTVWLARDCIADKYVSLKILTANTSEHSREERVLNHITRNNQRHPGRKYVSSLIDEFTITGPNGHHKCLVSEALGPTVSEVKESFTCDLLPLDIARRITVQLALGLAYIHSCGIIHGDIHIKNLAYKTLDFSSWPIAQVYECLGSPIKQIVSRNDNSPPGPEAPSYTVIPANLLELRRHPGGDISILDFGEASFASESRRQWHTPILLQAPEALLGEPVGQPTDIWAFACTIFAIFNNKSLFEGFMPNADDVLSEIVDTLGRLPNHWWRKWEQRGEFYEEDGRKKTDGLVEEYREVKPLAVRLRRMRSSPPAAKEAEQLSEEDLAGLQQLMERCLRYKPEDRATAEDILNLEWIRKLRANP
ncbi:MAG: hypothetical protein M1836_007929 [Candelina mexicana]|nr:MAG: hypothetical protein M1836_007929 [Candelina mexicana]